MSQLDALLARSRSPGTFVEKRTFTLARSKAIEKMREFSLRHPRQYVLELVQAAIFAGARWIAVDASRESLVVAWVGGEMLATHQLEGLFDHLFADQGVAETRYLMQTAVGVNAVLQRKPRRVRIESGDGTQSGTARLDLDGRGRGEVGTPESPLAGTYIYAEFPSTWMAYLTGSDSGAVERELVETRCLYTPVPILLNGNAPFGYRSSRDVQLFGVRKVVSLEDGRRGALGLPEQGVQPQLRIVVGGVWITDRVVPELGSNLVGVIADDRLRKTADMSDVVEDARWFDMLHSVQPQAVQLQRTVRPDYQPPRLPARIADDLDIRTEAEPAEPLPRLIPQLDPRAAIPLAALQAMDPQEPLFWIESDRVDALAGPCAPHTFPYRVLVLTPGQARTLESALGRGPAPSRLTHAEDVSFVRNAMERRQRMHRASVPAMLSGDKARADVRCTVALRLHVEGPEPRWDVDHGAGGVPVAVVSRGRTVHLSRVEADLSGVSVLIEVEPQHASRAAELATSRSLRGLLHREAWRLVPEDRQGPASALERALLLAWVHPHFERDPTGMLRVTPRLPSTWSEVEAHLLDAPLVETDEGPLSLRDLAELQGTDRSVTLLREADRALVEPFEAVYGFGHVLCASDASAPLVAVARTLDTWQAVDHTDLGAARLEQIVLIFPGWVEPPPPPGWTAERSLGPGVVHWTREDTRARDVGGAVRALFARVDALSAARWEPRAIPESIHHDRADAMARLACLHLAARFGLLSERTLVDDEGTRHDVATAIRTDLPLVARGGAQVRARAVLPVTLDEARALLAGRAREGLSLELPLILDDHPSTWSQADDLEDAWLVRLPLSLQDLSGWLGLRLPWDPTPGVLLETADRLEVLPGFTDQVPCHGLLHLEHGDGLTPSRYEQLHFAGVQLYQALLQRMDEDLPAAALDAAHRYATAYATLAFRRAGGRSSRGLARTLATRVPVETAEGTPWGTLRDWLEAAPDDRPPPPPGMPPLPRVPVRAKAEVGALEETWEHLRRPLESALRAQVPDASCRVVDGGEGGPMLRARPEGSLLRLAVRRDALAERSLRGEPTATGILLIEGLRQLSVWTASRGTPMDLLAAQQALLAAWITRT